jgi:mannosyltransferase OCH1-like enzyme
MINQILLLDNSTDESLSLIDRNKDRFKHFYPELEHKVWGMEEVRNFIFDRFGKETTQAFDTLKPYAYKADLARLCLLYELGGFYFDIHAVPACSMIPSQKLMVFRDIQRNSFTSWAVQTNVMYSEKAQYVFQLTIEKILSNVSNKYYGITALCPTGPTVFGESLVKVGANLDMIIGDFIELTPSFSIKNNASILPDGKIFAFGKTLSGGDINLPGSNNYGQMWFDKDIYNGD